MNNSCSTTRTAACQLFCLFLNKIKLVKIAHQIKKYVCSYNLLVLKCACFPYPASIAKPVSGSCDQLKCFHGATCKEKLGEAQCICDFRCTSKDDDRDVSKGLDDTTVCGSDKNTYGSECQLKLFSCRYQKRIDVIGDGPCSKCKKKTAYSEGLLGNFA